MGPSESFDSMLRGIVTTGGSKRPNASHAYAGPVAASLESRVHELEGELQWATRERDILKKALIIFGRSE